MKAKLLYALCILAPLGVVLRHVDRLECIETAEALRRLLGG